MSRKESVLAPKRNLGDVNEKTTVENKLTKASMLLSYQFEYGVNFKERIINITGDIDDSQFDLVDAALTEMESQSKKDITIKINSEGGSTYQAMAIVGRMLESKCGIITKGYGAVMSAATLILASGTRKRMLSRCAEFMHHEAAYNVEGRHSAIRAAVNQTEKEERKWADRMADVSNMDSEFWMKEGVGVDAYFTAQQLLDMEVVDELF